MYFFFIAIICELQLKGLNYVLVVIFKEYVA